MDSCYDFNETFKELSKIHDTSIVFNDWLCYCIDQFIINSQDKYFSYNNYTTGEYKVFWRLFECWIHGMEKALQDHKWYDLLGVYYEENVKSHGKASDMGQFFTPHDVCELMTELNTHKDDVISTVYDPAGGSGRFLLSYHVRHPRVLCFSHDIDETSCRMATLNFLIHGIKGSVCKYDGLQDIFYTGWKINEEPLSIQKVDNISESLIFKGEEIQDMGTLKDNSIKWSQSCLEDYG